MYEHLLPLTYVLPILYGQNVVGLILFPTAVVQWPMPRLYSHDVRQQARDSSVTFAKWMHQNKLHMSHRNGLRQLHVIKAHARRIDTRSEEHKSELQSLMRNSYAGFCLQKKKQIRAICSGPYNTKNISERQTNHPSECLIQPNTTTLSNIDKVVIFTHLRLVK